MAEPDSFGVIICLAAPSYRIMYIEVKNWSYTLVVRRSGAEDAKVQSARTTTAQDAMFNRVLPAFSR